MGIPRRQLPARVLAQAGLRLGRDVRPASAPPLRLPAVPRLGDDRVNVVAFDCSIRSLGWAVLAPAGRAWYRQDSGTWSPSEAEAAPDRWEQICDQVTLRLHRSEAAVCLVEVPNEGGLRRQRAWSPANMITYGEAVGVVFAAAYTRLGPQRVGRVPVNAWKGAQTKRDTVMRVLAGLAFQPRDDNEGDALGLALWFVNRGTVE